MGSESRCSPAQLSQRLISHLGTSKQIGTLTEWQRAAALRRTWWFTTETSELLLVPYDLSELCLTRRLWGFSGQRLYRTLSKHIGRQPRELGGFWKLIAMLSGTCENQVVPIFITNVWAYPCRQKAYRLIQSNFCGKEGMPPAPSCYLSRVSFVLNFHTFRIFKAFSKTSFQPSETGLMYRNWTRWVWHFCLKIIKRDPDLKSMTTGPTTVTLHCKT